MAYNSSTEIITPPVSIYDLQQCFATVLRKTVSGETQSLLSADLGVIIGKKRNETIDGWTVYSRRDINKFARFKPVPFNSVGILTDANRAAAGHGITFPDVVTGSTVTGGNIMDAAANDWDYQLPRGGTYNEPFRLADFGKPNTSIGYNHLAVPPIQVVYPQGGWTFLRGSDVGRTFVIYIDLDPADSSDNLQATDFVASGLDLNNWKLVAYLDSQYLSTKIFYSDDYILDGGEIAGNTIACTIPSGTGSYSVDVYICMYRYNSGRYEFLPLPKQGDYNPTIMKLNIIDDAQQSGGGIPGNTTEEMFNNVSFSFGLNSTYKTAWECTDNGTAEWSLKTQGDLYVMMNLKNTGTAASTIQRGHFQLDLDGQGLVSATTMYNASKQSVSSVSLAANGGEATIYLYFQGIFTGIGSDWTTSNVNSSWSMDFLRNGATLFGGDIYAYNATGGWTQR